MAISQNGWPLINARELDRSPFPGTDVAPVPGVRTGDVATLLHWVGSEFNKRVAPLYNPGCWGWNAPTPIPGSNIYSNHCSGTAIDLNAPSFPWGLERMSSAQRQSCRQIVNETEGVVAWGGDFTTITDEMHFEIVGGIDDVARIVRKLGEKNMNTNPTRSQIASLWLLANFQDLNQVNQKDREQIYADYEALPLQNLISDLTNGERRKQVVEQYLAGANSKADFLEVGVINGEKVFKRK